MAHLPRLALLIVVFAAAASGCAREYVTSDDVARCLGDDGIETRPLGDSSELPVLSFEIPGDSPARGLLMVAAGFGDASRLEDDIAGEARAQGHVAFLLREGNVVAHFLKRGGPTAEERERIRRCLR